jgi:5-methylcytosine-specific restriction endonuclease McrA
LMDSEHDAETVSAHSEQRGEQPTRTTSRRTTRQTRSAVGSTSVPGALPTLTRSARIALSMTSRQRGAISSPSGVLPRDDVAALYLATRRRRAAPYSRSDVFARWGGQCCYCDAPSAHLDHVTPLSRGGRDVLSNVVPACADCNLNKAAFTLAEWVATWEVRSSR